MDPAPTALVLAAGPVEDDVLPGLLAGLPVEDAVVVAADGGLLLADALGLRVDVVVGDLDSVPPSAVHAAVARGALVERHPIHKDRTDLALALATAMRLGAGEIHVLGGSGGRFDHLLANVLLLASDEFLTVRLRGRFGPAEVAVARPGMPVEIAGPAGAYVSLLAVAGVVTGVRSRGLRFGLDGDALSPGESRGVSNELLGGTATIEVDRGVLAVVMPHARHHRPIIPASLEAH